ncbi:MAG: alpha/beta hydrolase [Chloroflexi bacterium]|nr:alpha/beta hydrolase [Chloroflexota bacterium]MCI0579500.1 alpha/beta hydrolase [Chloroflexota bacterium]MCI0650203.1 alpha/beta hydrolase [Chloroflexota bacterium]MCI0729486.1 alpha/beta hydrolase [Chloroflexota bacterium]
MSITTIGDHLIHYEALGRGEPLIFVHGWLGSWRYWWPSMQELSTQHRTFAFDLWGYGDSSKAQNKYSFEAYVEMLDQFVDKLGIIKPFTLVGHALGAAVSLRYTLLRPQSIKKIIMVALPLQGGHINDRLTNTDSTSFINRVLGKSNVYPEVESETRKTDKAAMNAVASQLISYNFAADLEKCTCPALLVFGGQDPVVQPPAGDYSQLQRPENNRHYVSLDGCNHFPMLEQTAKFNRLLLDFIRTADNFTDIAPKEHWQRRTR